MISNTHYDHVKLAQLAAKFRKLSPKVQLDWLKQQSPELQELVLSEWYFQGRDPQIWPCLLNPKQDKWFLWLLLGGYGCGKSWTGSRFIVDCVRRGYKRPMIVGRTAADLRDTMIQGPSGLIAACDALHMRWEYSPSVRRFTFTDYGVGALTYSAEEPNQFKGPEHDCAWLDEQCAWHHDVETYGLILTRLRHKASGLPPRAMSSTTPEMTPLLKSQVPCMINAKAVGDWLEIYDYPVNDLGYIWVTNSSTYDNKANLAAVYSEILSNQYKGTRYEQTYLLGKVYLGTQGALFTEGMIEQGRVIMAPELVRTVVAIDPAGGGHDETGIVVVGKDAADHGYLLADISGQYSPQQWAKLAVDAAKRYGCDMIVAEKNYGGEMVKSTLQNESKDVLVKLVTATRGKVVRAEPVAAIMEQGRIHHVGHYGQLELQLMQFTPGVALASSPDRADAYIWGLTELLVANAEPMISFI